MQIEVTSFIRHVWGDLQSNSGFQGDVQLVLVPSLFLDNTYSIQTSGFALTTCFTRFSCLNSKFLSKLSFIFLSDLVHVLLITVCFI
jgi:hypothetical protein